MAQNWTAGDVKLLRRGFKVEKETKLRQSLSIVFQFRITFI
jgi:hypothetical protein